MKPWVNPGRGAPLGGMRKKSECPALHEDLLPLLVASALQTTASLLHSGPGGKWKGGLWDPGRDLAEVHC